MDLLKNYQMTTNPTRIKELVKQLNEEITKSNTDNVNGIYVSIRVTQREPDHTKRNCKVEVTITHEL